MRCATAVFALTLVFLSAGCNEQTATKSTPPSVSQTTVASAQSEDISVTLRLPKNQFVTGEEIPVTILANNLSSGGVRFSSSTSAPYRIRLERSTPLGWEVFKIYPEASAMVLAEWVLMPGEKRTIQTKLLVERDWPTYENLRLRVNLPDREDVAPTVYIEVTPK